MVENAYSRPYGDAARRNESGMALRLPAWRLHGQNRAHRGAHGGGHPLDKGIF